MIDTIVLTLNANQFFIGDHDLFTPSSRLIFEDGPALGSRSNIQCKQNPTAEDLRKGKYKPRLTLNKRFTYTAGIEITLRVEISLPKLLFGNNFEELVEDDFATLLDKLCDTLSDMGVITTETELSNSFVSAIHYGKNFLLREHLTTFQLIKQLSSSNTSGKLDQSKSEYRNGGHSFKIHANSFEVVFYDKVADLKRAKISNKRSLEADNEVQQNLLEKLINNKQSQPLDILRMEVRLGKRSKIRSLLRELKSETEPTFANLFSSEICRLVLLNYLDLIEKGQESVPKLHNGSFVDFMASMRAKNPHISLNQALAAYGHVKAAEELETKEIKNLADKFSTSAWRCLNRKLKLWGYANKSTYAIGYLRQDIESGVPIRDLTLLNTK